MTYRKITVTMAILIATTISTAWTQGQDVNSRFESTRIIGKEFEAELRKLKSSHLSKIEQLNSDFESDFNSLKETVASRIDAAKTKAAKAERLDEAVELRSFKNLIKKREWMAAKLEESSPDVSSAFAPGALRGNWANTTQRLTLTIGRDEKRRVTWNGKSAGPIAELGGRYWINGLTSETLELVPHKQFVFVLSWQKVAGVDPAIQNPRQLGILYRQ